MVQGAPALLVLAGLGRARQVQGARYKVQGAKCKVQSAKCKVPCLSRLYSID